MNLHTILLAQLVQPQRVVGIELGEGARVLTSRIDLNQLPVAGIETFPDPLIAGIGFGVGDELRDCLGRK